MPAVTVVIVSDYRAGKDKTWDDLRSMLPALAVQEFDESVEFLLMENKSDAPHIPTDVLTLLPGLRVLPSKERGSYGLKNEGVRAASAELVMIIDADCIPNDGWISAGVGALRANPRAFGVSGRSSYAGRTRLERILGLLSRAYVDRGQAGPIRYLSTNSCALRRQMFLDVPLPTNAGPFSYRLLTERVLESGGTLLFEPAMKVVHDFEGWPMERDMRRQMGWGSIRIRQVDDSISGSRVVKLLGHASVPFFYLYRMLESTWKGMHLFRHYGLRWYDVPSIVGIAAVIHTFEFPGMLRALGGEDAGSTVYR